MTELRPDQSMCDDAPGRLVPVVNPRRCENRGPCAEVCPYGVFEIRPPEPQEWRSLNLLTRLKVWVHGGKQAFVARPNDCRACGLCVPACPEKAITLVSASRAETGNTKPPAEPGASSDTVG